MNLEAPLLRYTPLPKTVPVGSPYRLDRASNIIRGSNFQKAHDALYTSGNQFYEAELYRFIKPFIKGERKDHAIVFGSEAKAGEMFLFWKSLAYAAVTAGENEGVSWEMQPGRMTPSFSSKFLETHLKQYLQHYRNQREDLPDDTKIRAMMDICEQGIEASSWPISKRSGNRYKFNGGPDMVFYLAALDFLSNHGFSGVIDSLKQKGLLDKEKHFLYGPLYSFLAENIFDHGNSEDFQKFIYGLSDVIGGDTGLMMAVLEVKYLRKNDDNTSKKLLLDRVQSGLQEKYLYRKYVERPEVVNQDTIIEAKAAAVVDPSLFWQVIFEREGVMGVMEEMFGKNTDLRPVYETALSERKVNPASLMMIAGALGLNREEAQKLAALSQFAWGMIVSYDNVSDGHKVRKGHPTQVAIDGVPAALDTVMLSLDSILSKTLTDSELHYKFLEMLRFSCKGNFESKRLDWDDSIDAYLENMAGLIKAFSWFPDYIGKKIGLLESGQNFTAFLAELHSLGQLNNDIEDIDPPKGKHEEGNDIGRRITLFWKILMDLPSNQVSEEEKNMIRRVFANRNSGPHTMQEDLATVLAIGKRCKAEVLVGLAPIVEDIYIRAARNLNLAFDSLPVMDEKNIKYQMIFSNTLETVRRLFP